MDLGKNLPLKDLWNHPNRLSEEMLRCMRNIFLSLSKSQSASSKMSSSKVLPSSSPVGHLSRPSITSLSDTSMKPQPMRSSSESCYSYQELILENLLDPYRVNGKVNWKNTGSYALADEVSWMSIGKEQLEYAAKALKKFRFSTKGGIIMLASWLSEAATEEQTTVLLVIFKYYLLSTIHKLMPQQGYPSRST